jgi:hypothetical protein
MKILNLFSTFVGHFALLDPDPATQINADPDADPDPQPWTVWPKKKPTYPIADHRAVKAAD